MKSVSSEALFLCPLGGDDLELLKGKKIMVWTFMGNARMYNALRDYGDRISQIGLFSFKVRATGEIYESGVSISSMLTYINRYPHINWLLTVANDGMNSIFRALRDNTNGAQDMFLSEIVRIMQKYPWCDGIDIDLEKGDGYSTHEESTAMFRNIYNTVKAYDPAKMMNICLPGMTSVNGLVGGENWCVYADLNRYCNTASIMSYGMAWAGSAPGPVSPRSWLEGIYDYASQVMDTEKVFLGMPAYGWNWQIYDLPSNIGKTYRGTSQTYYAAQNWLKGVYNFTDDEPPQPFIPFVGYWDDNNKVPWALPHVYDYMEGRDADSYSYNRDLSCQILASPLFIGICHSSCAHIHALFPCFFPHGQKQGKLFSAAAYDLIQQASRRAFGFPRCVGVDVHRGTHIGVT